MPQPDQFKIDVDSSLDSATSRHTPTFDIDPSIATHTVSFASIDTRAVLPDGDSGSLTTSIDVEFWSGSVDAAKQSGASAPAPLWLGLLKQELTRFTGFSLLLHSLIVLVLTYFGVKVVIPVQQEVNKAIQAQLVFVPLSPPSEPEVLDIAEEESLPLVEETVIEPATVEAEPVVNQVVEPPELAEPEPTTSEINQTAEIVEPMETTSETVTEPEYGVIATEDPNASLNFDLPFAGQMRSRQQAKDQSMLENAVQNRVQDLYKISGLGDPFAVPEPDSPIKVKNVNCDSTLNTSLATLSGMLGGNIRCTQNPDLNQFIQNRIDKKQN